MNMFSILKTSAIAFALTLSYSGCASKEKEFIITQNAKPISDKELSAMSVNEFHKFMTIKPLYYDRVFTYANANELTRRFCELKGSDLFVYNPSNKVSLSSNISKILKEDYDRKPDDLIYNTVYRGCKLNDTNEYLELTTVSSVDTKFFGPRLSADYTNFLEINTINKYQYDKYMEDFKLAKFDKYNYDKYSPEYNKQMEALRNRKGTYEQVYYDTAINNGYVIPLKDDKTDNYNFNNLEKLSYKKDEECAYKCKQENMKNNGYAILKESLREDWKIQSSKDISISDKFKTIADENNIRFTNYHCFCNASKKYVMVK